LAPSRQNGSIERVIERIREARNFDFRNYKRATLQRRIERRLADRHCRGVDEYLDLLDRSPEEYDALISGMLIKVTSFFRDPEAWELLRKRVLPRLLAEKRPGDELRVWSAGCATGEETYSIAMVLAELLGDAAATAPVKVFGTDVDEAAIAYARRGIYTRQQVAGLSRAQLARWFTPTAGGHAVSKDLRRMVVFGVNDLVSAAPISRLDLLVCRNVFIYLDANLQKRVLARFRYALRPGGILFLGKSELIPIAGKLFAPVDMTRRIYRRAERAEPPKVDEEHLASAVEQEDIVRAAAEGEGKRPPAAVHRDALLSVPIPVIAASLDGTVTLWNAAAARLWKKPARDVEGKKLTALRLDGLSGELLVEKTAAVTRGKTELRAADGVIPAPGGGTVHASIQVAPVHDARNAVVGVVYVVNDVSALHELEAELRTVRSERLKAVEDLQTTNEELQSSNEELETTNEELQSANEELQTANEELQSTNEELETTNEELQSTNSELDATNRELAQRTDELNVLSFYQRTIIRSLSAAVIVLDTHGRITLWNLASERLLGLTENEALGQLLWSLRIPILGRALVKQVRAKLAKGLALRVEDVAYERSTGPKGHAAISAVPLVDEGRNRGAVVILEDTTRAVVLAEERIRDGGKARTAAGKRPRDGATRDA
jgi:two-component system, chemotaxis family, CheB/CheR fusion protein